MTKEEFEQVRLTDIRTVDPSTVPDISQIEVNTQLPPEERVADVVRQMNGNPFFYRCGDILVKSSFVGDASIQSLLEDCLERF